MFELVEYPYRRDTSGSDEALASVLALDSLVVKFRSFVVENKWLTQCTIDDDGPLKLLKLYTYILLLFFDLLTSLFTVSQNENLSILSHF